MPSERGHVCNYPEPHYGVLGPSPAPATGWARLTALLAALHHLPGSGWGTFGGKSGALAGEPAVWLETVQGRVRRRRFSFSTSGNPGPRDVSDLARLIRGRLVEPIDLASSGVRQQ